MLKSSHLLILISLHLSFSVQAQSEHINEDTTISKLVNQYININKSTKTLEGWRIQILATTDRQAKDDAIRSFNYKYAGFPVDWVHVKPYYKVMVGAFETKLEAIQLLQVLKKDYPNAFPAHDSNIKTSDLVDNYNWLNMIK